MGQYEQGSSGLPGVAGSSRLAFQLSVCLSRAAPNHGAPSHPLSSLFALLKSLYPVILVPHHTQCCPSAKPHTHGTAFISLVLPVATFPRLRDLPSLNFLQFVSITPMFRDIQLHSGLKGEEEFGGCSGLACSPGSTNIKEGNISCVSQPLSFLVELCRGLRVVGQGGGGDVISIQSTNVSERF